MVGATDCADGELGRAGASLLANLQLEFASKLAPTDGFLPARQCSQAGSGFQCLCFLEYNSHTCELLAGMAFRCGTHTTKSCLLLFLKVWTQLAQVWGDDPSQLH